MAPGGAHNGGDSRALHSGQWMLLVAGVLLIGSLRRPSMCRELKVADPGAHATADRMSLTHGRIAGILTGKWSAVPSYPTVWTPTLPCTSTADCAEVDLSRGPKPSTRGRVHRRSPLALTVTASPRRAKMAEANCTQHRSARVPMQRRWLGRRGTRRGQVPSKASCRRHL